MSLFTRWTREESCAYHKSKILMFELVFSSFNAIFVSLKVLMHIYQPNARVQAFLTEAAFRGQNDDI